MSSEEAKPASRIPIYCVNLPRSADRRQAMTEQGARLGLDITFIEAVDGRLIDPTGVPEYLAGVRAKHGRSPLLPTAVACALSHKRALLTFLASGKEAGVILEDDAILEPQFEAVVNAIVSETKSWDMVKLWRTKTRKTAHFPVRNIAGAYNLVAPLSTTHGLVAVLYSRAGAQKAVLSLDRFYEDVDTHVGRCWKTGLKILEVRPYVVRHSGVESTIDAQETRASLRSHAPTSLNQRARQRLFRLAHSTLNPLCVAYAALTVRLRSRPPHRSAH